MKPTQLRELADNVDAFCTNRNCDEIAAALRAIADRDEKLRVLVEKWRATSINAPCLRRYARYECADELSALLGE